MRLARVFPHKRSSFTPTDRDCYFGFPDIKTTPFYDAVDVSVVFTWDKKRAEELAVRWRHHADSVRIGGCGNGVVPATAERAFRVLYEELKGAR